MTREEATRRIARFKETSDGTYEWETLVNTDDLKAFEMAIKALEQEPNTGRWETSVDRWGEVITTVNGYRCSECGEFNGYNDNYCPNCGARMESEE